MTDVGEERSGSSEAIRKLVHISFGFGALLLRWLTPFQAAAVAAAAVLFNWLILPHIGGRKIARTSLGYDRGIILYPLSVLALILVFRDRPDIAATVWVIMAFGDGTATLVGRLAGKSRIPWNRDKSVLGTMAFIEVALPLAYLIQRFINPILDPIPPVVIITLTVLVAAIAETLPLGIDDNLTVPLFAGATMFFLTKIDRMPVIDLDRTTLIWLAVNFALALAGYLAKTVNLSGFIGGALIGAGLILFADWQLYAVLLMFFVIGSAVTKLGYRKKAARGLAQEGGGRRGFSHAWSNVGVALICAFLIACSTLNANLLWLAAAAALITATSDTSASEIGQLIGKRAYMPLTFRRVEPGTEGAVSIAGTLFGIVVSAITAVIAMMLWASRSMEGAGLSDVIRRTIGPDGVFFVFYKGVLLLVIAAFAGSYAESIIGSMNRDREKPIPNGVLNFFNTAVGAAVMFALSKG